MYLELGVDASQKFKPDIQQILLKNKNLSLKITYLRGYHPLRRDYSKYNFDLQKKA